jgi:hypothetical protein
MGKSYQSKNIFPDAITYYKKFIEKTDPDNPLRSWAKDELTRCANGARLKFASEETYVENAGTSINTQYDEFGVRNSPTLLDKIYFNSNRGDMPSGTTANNNVDIFSASIVNGNWTTPAPLPASVNSTEYDEVCGFSLDGQILYFLSEVGNEFKIRTDTFSGQEDVVYQGVFAGPYRPDGGGTDLTFFNDSICLFSSDRAGGFGGYDVYVSKRHNGTWSDAVNLGPTINSFYNERYPFLTKNGQTLFFSSDNLESVGGYDVFRSIFDPINLSWSIPDNLGMPVNSSLDDTHMVLTSDGITGFVTSNRKTGYGGKDIYRVYFKQAIVAQQEISFVPSFFQILLLKGMDQMAEETATRPVEVKEYFLSHLFLEEGGEILTPQNTKKLDLLANLMLIYPQIQAELSGFELPSGPATYNLYFSIKKVEKAAQYLQQKGIQSNRIFLKGYGSSFPIAIDPTGDGKNPLYLKLNHRIEIGLHNFESEPVVVHVENIPVPENIRDPHGEKFSSLRHELYYSIQIAALSQILQNTNLETVDEMFIDVDNAKGYYRYMVGMLPTYDEAVKKNKEMVDLGFPDAYIVPFVDGIRIKLDEVPGFALKYPDLLIYLANVKK